MNFLIIWLCTILLSFGMTISSVMRLIKDVVDLGYKIDMKSIDKIDSIGLNSNNNVLLSMFIPFYNIMFAMQVTMQYNSGRSNPIDSLRVMGLLEYMSKEEIEEYSKNPTVFNALSLTILSNKDDNSEVDLTNASYIKFHDDGSEVYFDTNDEFYDIIILKVTGPLSKLSKSKQLKKVRGAYQEMQKSIIENTDNNGVLNVEKNVVPINEQIKYLKGLKEGLLSSNNKDNDIKENNLKLVKKK